MRCGKLLIEQVVHLIVVDLEVAALDDKDSLFERLTLVYLAEKVLQTVDQDAFVFHLLDRGGSASVTRCAALIDVRAAHPTEETLRVVLGRDGGAVGPTTTDLAKCHHQVVLRRRLPLPVNYRLPFVARLQLLLRSVLHETRQAAHTELGSIDGRRHSIPVLLRLWVGGTVGAGLLHQG